MIVLGYIGDHKKDGIAARLGWAIIRLAQINRGKFKRVTHVECVLDGTYDNCLIASSSLRDGGVRVKSASLNPDHWIAIDVPVDAASVARWFDEHSGEKYDWRGALASVLWFLDASKDEWFCNEAIGAALGFVEPDEISPAQFMAQCLSFGEDVTGEFFRKGAA